MRLTLIGYYLLCWVVGVLLVMCCGGCCHKTYESIVRDTVTVVRVDSVIVHMREVEVSLPVPQITLSEKVPLCDTLLILDNGLYQSTVEIKDGQVTHTLKPSENADSLHATVHVADTTHIHHDATNTVHHEREKEVVKQEESWWDRVTRKVSWTAIVMLATVLLVLGVLWRFRTKR